MFFTINDREKYIFNSQRYDTWFNRPYIVLFDLVCEAYVSRKGHAKKNFKKEKNPSIVVSKEFIIFYSRLL